MRERVMQYLKQLPVADGTNLSYVWQRYVSEGELNEYLSDWLIRLQGEADYAALVSWVSRWMAAPHDVSTDLGEKIWRVVSLASNFPETIEASWEWTQLTEKFVQQRPEEVAKLLMGAVETGTIMIHALTPASDLLQHATAAAPEAVFEDVMERISRGSWQVQLAARGWLLGYVPVEVIDSWMSNSLERGRRIASIADAGGTEPSPVARLLLTQWPNDQEIGASLAGDFMTESWTGPFSHHLGKQVEQLRAWISSPTESAGVKRWARRVVKGLEAQRREASEREAEGNF